MRILGIDVGSTSIKAVEIDSAFGRYEIHEYHEHPVEPNAENTGQQIALAKLLESLPKAPDRIAVALRARELTFRSLEVPTRDKKAIQSAIAFELDDDLPFPFDQAAFDSTVLATSKKGTSVHVAVTLRRYLTEALARWSDGGVDPDLVTTEASAFRSFLNRVQNPAAQERPVLLVQIGQERTVLYIHYKGAPVFCREIAWGGRDLTAALSKRYQVQLPQAEQTKLDHGFVLPHSQRAEATQEQIEFSDALLGPVEKLAWHLRQAKVACKSITQHTLSQIYLSGGTSNLPGLPRVLEELLTLPVQPLRALSSIATSGVTYSEHADSKFLTAVSLALCLVGQDRNTVVNFRKGSFAKQGKARELSVRNLRGPLIAVSAIAASLFLSLIIQSSFYKSQLADVDSKLEKSVRTFFGGQLSSTVARNYLASPNTLRTNVNKELRKKRDLAQLMSPNPRSPIEFLKTLSSTIPKDVVVDLITFQAGASPSAPYSSAETGETTLTFLVPNPQTAERLNAILANEIKALQPGKLEKSNDRFKISFSGKPMETAYGK